MNTKPGTIYESGDQYYQVIASTAKTITLRPIKAVPCAPGEGCPHYYTRPVVPVANAWDAIRNDDGELSDQPITRRLIDTGHGLGVKINRYHNIIARPWDGNPLQIVSNLG